MSSDLLAMECKRNARPARSKVLERIAALTGAEQVCGDSYWLRAGRRNFLVGYQFDACYLKPWQIDVLFCLRRTRTYRARSDCICITATENNPRLFKKWENSRDLFSGEWEDVWRRISVNQR